MPTSRLLTITAIMLAGTIAASAQTSVTPDRPLPRTKTGKPDFSGIWQASGSAAADLLDHAASFNMLPGRSVVLGGQIPYQPWAAAKKAENFKTRQTADPLSQCYMPGTPRIMYMDYPFQVFQTPEAVAFAFEWSLVYRLIHTDGSKHPEELDSWMGDSRGHWEGDTLVVDVANYNDKTWFDMAGDFHSGALHVTERYQMTDPDTILYEATMEDAKVFTKPWTIRVPLRRRTDRDRLFEYHCDAEYEEANGLFTRENRTWYPGDGSKPAPIAASSYVSPAAKPIEGLRRTADGKPDLRGFWESNTGAANQGLEKLPGDNLTPASRGIVVDPADGKLPLQQWAIDERKDRNKPERGYDDPTAHCFPAGVPRSMYVPAALHIIQTPEYIVFLHERMSWRIVPLTNRPHLPDNMRLWHGDSIGHWEGDTLVVETTNLNGKTWLNEVGDVISYAATVVERFTPTGPDALRYEATVTDPVAYTRPWTISFPVRHNAKQEMYEVACHEEDRDLPHLKAVKDAASTH